MLNIARLPFVPAYMTLMLLAIAAGCTFEPFSAASAVVDGGAGTLLPGWAISHFQGSHPILSPILAILLLFYTGLLIGRISTRYGLYTAKNCLAIPLFAIIVCAALPQKNYLATLCAMTLFGLAIQSFCRACRNDYGFDALFRASFYLGFMPFILPASLPLLLLSPIAIIVFRRSTRELIVAMAGLILPALVVCYLCWGGGSTFLAPLQQLWSSLIGGPLLNLFLSTPIPSLILLGLIAVIVFAAVILFLANAYTSGSRPRYILTFNLCTLLLSTIIIFLPSAPTGLTAIVALPAALFLPIFFVRIHHHIATPIYLILLLTTTAGLFLW